MPNQIISKLLKPKLTTVCQFVAITNFETVGHFCPPSSDRAKVLKCYTCMCIFKSRDYVHLNLKLITYRIFYENIQLKYCIKIP